MARAYRKIPNVSWGGQPKKLLLELPGECIIFKPGDNVSGFQCTNATPQAWLPTIHYFLPCDKQRAATEPTKHTKPTLNLKGKKIFSEWPATNRSLRTFTPKKGATMVPYRGQQISPDGDTIFKYEPYLVIQSASWQTVPDGYPCSCWQQVNHNSSIHCPTNHVRETYTSWTYQHAFMNWTRKLSTVEKKFKNSFTSSQEQQPTAVCIIRRWSTSWDIALKPNKVVKFLNPRHPPKQPPT
jgi:hypothetical protein